jgi:hypothetical protein
MVVTDSSDKLNASAHFLFLKRLRLIYGEGSNHSQRICFELRATGYISFFTNSQVILWQQYKIMPRKFSEVLKNQNVDRRCATSRKVPGSISGGVTWDFSRGPFRQNHVPWCRLSLWKWVPGISLGVKAASAFGWRPTTLVVPKVEKIRGLNLPGTP